jgi:tetratricopeptide (TPR) repeat protein
MGTFLGKRMHEQHASPEVIQRFLRSELSTEESADLVRHLVARCPHCLSAAGRVAWTSPAPLPALGRLSRCRVHRAGYDEAFAAAGRRMDARERELALQRALAVEQWRELRLHPSLRRRWRIRNDSRFGTWGFCERLLEECLMLGGRDPAQAEELAGLAVDASVRLGAERYGAERVADLQTFAWGVLGEAHRLQLDLSAAGEALTSARAAFRKGTRDPLEEARLVSFEMSLATDEGEIERAVEMLGWAARVYRRAGERHCEGRALLLQAEAAGELDPERGLDLLEQALELTDRGDPWLDLSARHHRISFLDALGRSRYAAMLLDGARHLYRRFGDLRTRTALRWLEGRIAKSLGDLVTAEKAFEEVLPVFAERGLRFQLSRLSLDLAVVYMGCGKTDKALHLAFGAFEALEAVAAEPAEALAVR